MVVAAHLNFIYSYECYNYDEISKLNSSRDTTMLTGQ